MLLDLWPAQQLSRRRDKGSSVQSGAVSTTKLRRVHAELELVWEVRVTATVRTSTSWTVRRQLARAFEIAAEIRSPLCIESEAAWSVRQPVSKEATVRWKRSPSWQRVAAWRVDDEAEILIALDLI